MLHQITGVIIGVPKNEASVAREDYSWKTLGNTEEERKKALDDMLAKSPTSYGEGFKAGLHHGLEHMRRHAGEIRRAIARRS